MVAEEHCLRGLRVVDWTDVSGQLAGRILADLGAEVLLVEPPGGDPGRRTEPGSSAFAGAGATWVARNLGKRSVVVDTDQHGGERLMRLAAAADVFIENRSPAERERAGIDLASLRARHPSLVICSISPYGRGGPRGDQRGSDLTAIARSGNLYITGDPDRPPVRCSMPVSEYHTAAEAAAAILMALYRRDRCGDGDVVDVSMQETMAMANVTHTAQAWGSGYRGARAGSAYRAGGTTQREIWPCKDGYVTFALRGGKARVPGLIAIAEVMKEAGFDAPAICDRDWSRYNHNLLDQAEVDEMSAALEAYFRTRTMREHYDAACERRLMLAPANSEREVLDSRQLAARDFFTRAGEGGPSVPARFARVPGMRVRTRLPELGEADGFETGGFARAADGPPGAGRGIFAGLRVVEFGSGAAAPLATRYFADQGATVIKVESRMRPDFLRTLRDDGSGKLDHSLFFACVNPNKLSVALNMKDPRGVAVARRLIAGADVVVENFAPGVMAKWGLDYESVRQDCPRLIMASTCLWGQTGPERGYPGFGGQGSALAGFNHVTGWPDRAPLGPFGTITDSLSPRFAVAAIAAALLRRARTGEGAYIDVSQVETGVYSLTEWLLAYQETGRSSGRVGNHSPHAVPHGVFPVRGDDDWIAIAVHSDADWLALREVMGQPDWARAPELDTLPGRLRERARVEAEIAAWTAPQDGAELAARLQSAGLDAAPVANLQEVLADAQLAHRGHFVQLEHPVLGAHVVEAIGARFASSPMSFDRPAPCLGADTEHVCRDILDMSGDELEELRAGGVLA